MRHDVARSPEIISKHALSICSMMTVAVVVKMMMLLERACLRLVEGFRLLPVWYALLRIPSVTTA
jgi:hypothetical protein